MNINEATKLAIEQIKTGNLQSAEHILKDILKIQSENVTALHFLGVIYYQLKKYDSAIEFIKKAVLLEPKYVDAHNNLGLVLQETGQLDEAIIYYQRAIHVNPSFAPAYYNLGFALYQQSKLNEAIKNYISALTLKPDFIEAYVNLGNIFRDLGKLEEAEKCYRCVLQIKPSDLISHQALLMIINYNSRYDPQTIFSEHLQFAKRFAAPLSDNIAPYTNTSVPDRRLKLGYVSPDFKRHSVAYFIEPVIISHNRENVEVFCYSDVSNYDEVTKRVQKNADHWRSIAGISDEQVAELIRKDRIDILIDLAGHTADNRMLLFARKPAPVQVTWIGYPATTGLSTIDYKIVDRYTDPPGMTEHLYTEELIRLPDSFLCYLSERDCPKVGYLPVSKSGHVAFGSFNNFTKVSPEVISLWAKILRTIPNSHLIIKTRIFSDKSTLQYVIGLFTQEGINSERIELLSSNPLFREHLDTYNRIDIGLDTFPYNGVTTTCEALWMGVPVITLAGNTHASRVGVSILSSIDAVNLIAKTKEEYVDIAVNLANNIERLHLLRKRLRDMMANSYLTDAKRFTFNLETSYRWMWQKWCKGQSTSLYT